MPNALVTGGARRLGRAMCLYLAGRGYDVAIHYASSGTEAEALQPKSAPWAVAPPACRPTCWTRTRWRRLSRTRQRRWAGRSVLVNNASIFEQDSIATATRESWDRHMMSNLRAPFVLTQAFAAQVPPPVPDPAGEPVAQGLVVNMIDQKVRNLTPEHMTYSIAKMGLWAFTRMAAQELGGRVRVNAIGPGPTLQAHDQTREAYDASRRRNRAGPRREPRGYHRRAWLFHRRKRGHGAAFVHRWRATSGLASRYCHRALT